MSWATAGNRKAFSPEEFTPGFFLVFWCLPTLASAAVAAGAGAKVWLYPDESCKQKSRLHQVFCQKNNLCKVQ
jgi:hypothetical protein